MDDKRVITELRVQMEDVCHEWFRRGEPDIHVRELTDAIYPPKLVTSDMVRLVRALLPKVKAHLKSLPGMDPILVTRHYYFQGKGQILDLPLRRPTIEDLQSDPDLAWRAQAGAAGPKPSVGICFCPPPQLEQHREVLTEKKVRGIIDSHNEKTTHRKWSLTEVVRELPPSEPEPEPEVEDENDLEDLIVAEEVLEAEVEWDDDLDLEDDEADTIGRAADPGLFDRVDRDDPGLPPEPEETP